MKILAVGDFQGKFPERLKRRIRKEDIDLIIGVGDYTGVDMWKSYVFDLFKRIKRGDDRISPEEFYGKDKYKKLEREDFEEGKKVLSELNRKNKPIFSVFGNSDDTWYNYPNSKLSKATSQSGRFIMKLKNFRDITYSHKNFREFKIIGFGGYMDIEAYFKKNTFKAEREMVPIKIKRHARMKKLFFKLLNKANKNQSKQKILILHYPPYGVFDIIKDKKNPMNGQSAGIKFFREGIKKYKPSVVFCGHMHEYQGMKKLYGVPVINPGDAGEGKCAIVDIDSSGRVKARFLK